MVLFLGRDFLPMKRPSFSNDLKPGKNRQQISIETQKVVELTEEKNYHSGLST